MISADVERRRPSPRRAFWPGTSLDLAGAVLVDFDFSRVSVAQVRFDGTLFLGDARFNGAAFLGDAWFNGAAFQRDAWFEGAAFQHDALFEGATLQGNARFTWATFRDREANVVAGAQVLHLDDLDLNKRRAWPDGYTVRPDPADPTRGTLVRAEQVEVREPAVPPSDRPADNG